MCKIIISFLLPHILDQIKYKDPFVKILIILGYLKWYDVPHLHHPLINLRMQLEESFTRDPHRLRRVDDKDATR
jgi:hypothetical protein